MALLSPARFAESASGGRWACAKWLRLLDRKLMELAEHRASGALWHRGLVVEAPPRHGKSMMVSQYFPAWWLGTFPDDQIILTAYEADFAAEWGRKAQDVIKEAGKRGFGVEVDPNVSAASHWKLLGRDGAMRSVGMGGALTGKGSHALIVDDPIKNAEEALSEAWRRKAADWLESTALNRLEPGGVVVLMQTRWHELDPAGMILSGLVGSHIRWEELRLPALAEEDDPLGRGPGEALWPERFPQEQLEAIRDASDANTAGSALWFAAQYQQRPTPKEGGTFRASWFAPDRLIARLPPGDSFCRYWDRAGSEGKGDWTVGVLMHAESGTGPFTVAHVARFRHAETRRDALIREWAERDAARFGHVRVRGEQEPGSSGKDAAAGIVRKLAGYDAEWTPVTGDKETRARPLAQQMAVGNVRFLQSPLYADYAWDFAAYRAEFLGFPRGKHDDQVDASSGAFNCLALGPLSAPPVLVGGKIPGLIRPPMCVAGLSARLSGGWG